MPECPECKATIRHLVNLCRVDEAYIFDGKKYIRQESYDNPTYDEPIWICPVCFETLFEDEVKAIAFLLD